MKDNWVLLITILVYTVIFFWFGMWIQRRYDNYQLKKFTDTAWSQGCHECAQFEINECLRDNLQGIPEHPRIER